MSALVTRCPACGAAFRVTRGQLETAAGRVRCGACLTAFDAAAQRLRPQSAAGDAAAAPAAVASDTRDGRIEPRFEPEATPWAAAFEPAPAPVAGARRRVALQLLVVAVCALGVAGQYVYFRLDLLAQAPGARRWLETACAVLGCALPARRDLARIETQSVLVTSHPDTVGALRMEAVIVNRAAFEQPFPALWVEFQNLAGAALAMRRFVPAEYLAGELTGVERMPVERPIRLQLDLIDPGPAAVSYRLAPVE